MRCFKSFFKHTWQPQQMENPSRFKTSRTAMRSTGETELGEVKVQAVPTTSVATSTPIQPGSMPCRNGGCKSWKDRGGPERAESPWHLLKTIFLVTVIVALVLWVIIYTLLAQYQIL